MSKAFRAPKVVRKHPAFKKELSRQEAEIFLSLPGQRYVLRLNQEKNAIVISFVNGSGNIGIILFFFSFLKIIAFFCFLLFIPKYNCFNKKPIIFFSSFRNCC